MNDSRIRRWLAVCFFVGAGCFVLAGIWRFMDCRHFGGEEACRQVLMEGLVPAVALFLVGLFVYPRGDSR